MSGVRTTAMFSAVLCIAACGGDSGGVPAADSSRTEAEQPSITTAVSAEFAIESLPLDLAADVWQWPIDDGTWPAREFPPVHIFGKAYQGQVEATLMFDMLKVGTTVLSPISGRVVDVRAQPDSCDVELYIGDESAPPISLDHIVTTLQRGDVVTAGQPVGTVPKWQCKESFGGFELMVIGESGGQMLALCPENFFSTTLVEVWKPALATVMNDWNTHAVGRGYVTYSPEEITNGVCASPTAPS
jgi:hypothetical protein